MVSKCSGSGYSIQEDWSDIPEGVREQIGKLLAGFRAILDKGLSGVYLHGSLALGCFNPRRSDIDLLVVTTGGLNLEQKRELADLLLEVSGKPSPIEISFLRQEYIVPWEYPTRYDFHFSEDHRRRIAQELGSGAWRDWGDVAGRDEDLATHIMLTRKRGIGLVGPQPDEAFPPVPERDFLDSLMADVLSLRFGLNPEADIPVYMVLNACRTLAYLQTKQILSKDEGGEWALNALPYRLHDVVDLALKLYRTDLGEGGFRREDLMEFVNYMRAEIKQWIPQP